VTAGVVVGAAGGIGSACARRLQAAADTTILIDTAREPLDLLVGDLGPGATAVVADVATAEGRDAVVEAVREPIAWVVLAHGVPLRKPLAELREHEILDAFAVNLIAPTLLIRRLLDLEWASSSSIVVIGSISAKRALPQRAVYGATKAGIEQLARSLAAELAGRGINVNVVSPGVIDTPFVGGGSSLLEQWVGSHVPLARAGEPDEVAAIVEFVISGAPRYLTGARIAVDGGTEALG
jgi:NAD(P)-dependent dehydrogenase (short-subunit alcohol dehydrogenase family)